MAINKRITSYDVADKAGVSQSAVSRCFSSNNKIAEKTRQKILKVADELGYKPNAIARGLSLQKSNLVAVILTDHTNQYYPELLEHINKELSKHNIRVLLFTKNINANSFSIDLDQVWQFQVDGIISAVSLSKHQIEVFNKHRIPLVLYNRVSEHSQISSVSCDHKNGVRQIIEHLITKKHKNFGVISGPANYSVSSVRTKSAIAILKTHNLKYNHIVGDYNYECAGLAVETLLQLNENLDAVFCANDIMAIGCIDYIRYKLKRNDITVAGFDGIKASNWLSYCFTTVEQPISIMVKAAVAMLMERIDNIALPNESRLFAGKLRIGESNCNQLKQ